MSHVRFAQEGAVGVITLDRPPVNALTTDTYTEIIETFQGVSERDDISVVVFAAAGERAFCAGIDMKEVDQMLSGSIKLTDEERQRRARAMFDTVMNTRQPVIGAVSGPALGAGAVLVACCDVRYASERATIGLPEINVGRCGGGRHLMRLLPQGRLREMYFTGRPLDAQESYRLGLVEKVFPHGQEREAAMQLAREIATKSPLALRLAKEALNKCESLPVSEGYALEQTYTLRLGKSEDAKEAARAFNEKRPPVWKGR